MWNESTSNWSTSNKTKIFTTTCVSAFHRNCTCSSFKTKFKSIHKDKSEHYVSRLSSRPEMIEFCRSEAFLYTYIFNRTLSNECYALSLCWMSRLCSAAVWINVRTSASRRVKARFLQVSCEWSRDVWRDVSNMAFVISLVYVYFFILVPRSSRLMLPLCWGRPAW